MSAERISTEYCESIARSLEFLREEYGAVAAKGTDARWLLTSLSDGLETSLLQHTDSEFTTVRGRMQFSGIQPLEVIRLVTDCEHRTEWDDMLEKGRFALSYGTLNTVLLPECEADIIRLRYKGMMGVSSRDLCLLRAWGQDEDGKCWLVAESCENSAVPVGEGCVRAELRECGYMVVPTSEGSEVSYISQTNFNGWIPSWMQNIMMSQQPKSLCKMYEVLQKRKQTKSLEEMSAFVRQTTPELGGA